MKKQSIKKLAKQVLVIVTSIFVGSFFTKRCSFEDVEEDNLRRKLEEISADREGIIIKNNREVSSLKQLINEKDENIDEMASLILELKSKPSEVRYITEYVTEFVPKNVYKEIKIKDLQDTTLFGYQTKSGLLVTQKMNAEDSNQDGNLDLLKFDQYSLTFKLYSASEPKKTAAKLKVTSSYDNIEHTIPIEVDSIYIENSESENKKIKLSLSLGAEGLVQLGSNSQKIGWGLVVSSPWLHPTKKIDLLSPTISIGTNKNFVNKQTNEVARVGFNLISYNITSKKTIVQDTWVGAGANISTDSSIMIGVNLGTRL